MPWILIITLTLNVLDSNPNTKSLLSTLTLSVNAVNIDPKSNLDPKPNPKPRFKKHKQCLVNCKIIRHSFYLGLTIYN